VHGDAISFRIDQQRHVTDIVTDEPLAEQHLPSRTLDAGE
jgi:hypothetical protein